jgi:hypothetical protein
MAKGALASNSPPTALEEVFLTPRELAARWKEHPQTLANQRSSGEGPRYMKRGRNVRYRLSDVLAYEAQNLHGGEPRRSA